MFALFIFCVRSYGENADSWDLFSNYYQEQSNISQITLTDDIVAEDSIGYTPNNNFTIDGNAHLLDGNGNAGFSFYEKTITFNAITIMNFNDAFEMQNSQIKFLRSDGGGEIRITSNTRIWHGGAMAIDTQNDVSFENVSVFITSNTSQMNAGGIYVETNSKISFVNSSAVFAHNKAQTVGGGLYIRESQAHFLNSNIVFEDNRSELNGGAISFLSANDMVFENTDIEFRGNIAQNGGAIFGGRNLEPGIATNLRFINSQAAFFENNADYGTAIYLNEEQKIEFINSTVIFGDNAGADKTILFIQDGARVSFIGGAVVFSSNTQGRLKFINEKRNLIFAPSKVVFADNIRQETDGIFDYDDFKNDYNGFLMNGNSILFPIEVLRNKTVNGGFLAFGGDREFALTFQAGGTFRNNEALEKGAVFYLAHSEVSLTSNGDMIFNGNLANGESNDIFLEGAATLSLSVANGAKVLLGGGLKGDSDSRIIKRGAGALFLGGNTDYDGSIILQEGDIVVATQTIKLSSLNVGVGAVFRADGSDIHITTITNANFDGKFESALILVNGSLDLNNKLFIEDEMTAADPSFLMLTTRLETRTLQAAMENNQGGMEIVSTASQDMQGLGLPEKGQIRRGGSAIDYSLNYNDDGSLNIAVTGVQTRLNPDALNLTKEEAEIAQWINSTRDVKGIASWKSALEKAADEGQTDEIKKSLHTLKGTFLVNVLKLGAPNIDFSDLYNEIDGSLTQSQSGKFLSLKWKGGEENFKTDNSYEGEFKTKYNSFKVSLENVKRIGDVYGFFLNYEAKSISQNPNSANINDFSLGVYGAKSAGGLKAKGTAALSVKSFEIRRDVQIIDLSFQPQSAFELYGVKTGFELSYPLKKKRLTIEPFAAFAIESLKGGEIVEDSAVGLYADPAFLTYSEIDWGIKMESGWGRLGWNFKGYFGYDVLSPNVLNVSFVNDNSGSSIDIEAMENERLFIGGGLFIRFSLSPSASVFAGVDSKRSIKNFMRAHSAYLGLTIKI